MSANYGYYVRYADYVFVGTKRRGKNESYSNSVRRLKLVYVRWRSK